jgi:hypothetical protein
MAIKGAIPMRFDDVFLYGCYVVGEVQAQRDFDRSTKDQAVQAVDRDTGVLVWAVDVIDADPETGSGRCGSSCWRRCSRSRPRRWRGRRSGRSSSTA